MAQQARLIYILAQPGGRETTSEIGPRHTKHFATEQSHWQEKQKITRNNTSSANAGGRRSCTGLG